jgi:hypothetical protein
MTANSNDSKKKRGRGKPWKEGESGNPAGRPAAGQSWGEVIKEITDMTREELLDMVGETSPLAKMLRLLPDKVAVKYLIVISAAVGTMNDPNARILQWLADRSEGKVPDIIKGGGEGGAFEIIQRVTGIDADKV